MWQNNNHDRQDILDKDSSFILALIKIEEHLNKIGDRMLPFYKVHFAEKMSSASSEKEKCNMIKSPRFNLKIIESDPVLCFLFHVMTTSFVVFFVLESFIRFGPEHFRFFSVISPFFCAVYILSGVILSICRAYYRHKRRSASF